MKADELRAALERAGISQLRFARRLGVEGRTVRYWLAGRAIPADMLARFPAALEPPAPRAPDLSPAQWAAIRERLVSDYLDVSPVSPEGQSLAAIIRAIVAVYPAPAAKH